MNNNPLRLKQATKDESKQVGIKDVELNLRITNLEIELLESIRDIYNQKILSLGLYPSATITTTIRTLIAKEGVSLGISKETPAEPPVPKACDAIQIVMGRKTMRAQQIFEELEKRNWVPKSTNPLNYIRFVLASEGEIFLRKKGERGVYHLARNNTHWIADSNSP